jgi:hypothetical protein
MIVANSLRKCLQATDLKQENSRGDRRKRPRKRHDRNGERAGIRTLDPVIKSHVLYQLSYALPSRIRYLKASGFTSLARLFVALLLD